MKRLITQLITGALALPAMAADPAPLPADFDYTAVTNHFIECLEGQIDGVYAPAVYKSDYTIAHDDVAAVTARIWEEWAKANNKFTVVDKKEQDLRRSLKPFPGNLVSYTIPTSLEPYFNEPNEPYKYDGPDAKMQYNIGTPKPVVRENDTSYTYPAKAVLNIRTEGNRRRFREESINLEYYRHTYIDSTQTSDDYRNNIVEVSAKFVVNEHPKYKYLPGIYAGLDFRHEKYDQRTGYDTLIRQEYFGKRKYSGTYITAGLFNVDTNALMNFDVAGRLAVLGHYAGNFSVDGYISQALRQDKSSLLRADARFELQSANPFFNRYVGNHDRWENDFKAVKTIRVEGHYINKRLRTDVGVGFTNLFSHIYFDSTAMPRQFNKALVVFTAWGKEVFRAGHFYFDQSVYFQKSMQEDILSLPAISLYSHNYYQNYLFKGALQLQVGIDLFYNTSFYADNYAPSIMQFHLQREHKTGNYPKVDAFLNLHIKRAQLFVKYEHANYHIKRKGNFFSAADYPINPGMLKFGVQWDFFD